MKKVILILTIVISGLLAQAQDTIKTLIVNGKDINKIENEYIDIVCYNTSIYGKSWAVNFDIGDPYVNWKGHTYKDENGNTIDFNSPMDAVNYLIKCGWKFISRTSNGQGNATYLYFMMYKKK